VVLTRETIERVICPLWGSNSGAPEQIGSAVLVEDDHESLLLTAGHVMRFDELGYRFAVGGADQARLFRPTGHAFAFKALPETPGGVRDIYDFGGLFLDQESADSLRANFEFVKPSDIEARPVQESAIAVLHGFPCRRSSVSFDAVINEAMSAVSRVVPSQNLPKGGYSAEHHIFVHFNRRRGWYQEGSIQQVTLPIPHGMSGGGIFIDVGGRALTGEFKLAGIITEYHEKIHIFGGTRISSIFSIMRDRFQSRWGSLCKK
jgi:hypothetical protein